MAPDPGNVGRPLVYALAVVNIPSPIGGGACPNVRFGYPTGIPFTFISAMGTNGYTAIPDVNGITFTGGCVSSQGGTIGTASLTIIISPLSTGTLNSLGSNVVVDPENNWNETNEANNTATTIQTTVILATPTNTPTHTVTATATNTATATATATPSNLRSRADFDGDGKTDVSVFRASEGNWYINRSIGGIDRNEFRLEWRHSDAGGL